MTLEKLKELLEVGTITQEQFTELCEKYGFEVSGEDEPEEEEKPPAAPEQNPDIETMIQKAIDRATNKLGNDNKKLREQLEKLKKDKLTTEEQAELDRQEREQELLDREQKVRDSEIQMHAVKAIKKAGLDDGSETALDILALVKGKDEDSTDANVKALKALVDKMVKAKVDATFKAGGRTPETGAEGGGEDNPWSPNSFNLTKQMELEASDPAKAKVLKAAAGIK